MGQRLPVPADLLSGRWMQRVTGPSLAFSGVRDLVVDRTIRLWRSPDVNETPPHKRSHDEFLAMLRRWTNLRVVKDENAPRRWRLEPEPFPR